MVQIIGSVQTIEDLINDPTFDINQWHGYVYLTVHELTGRKYIGKKSFFHTQNKKLGKKELLEIPITRGRRPTKKKIVKESDWKTYYGSSEQVKALPISELKRYLIKLCKSSKQLTYWETKNLFQYNVLEDDSYLNDNIEGRYFRKDIID